MRKLAAVAICLLATLIGFLAGFILAGRYAERVLYPKWAAAHPHDGQLGLGIVYYAGNGGVVGGIVALAIAIYCCWRWLKGRPLSATA